jgi:hypothetical protein
MGLRNKGDRRDCRSRGGGQSGDRKSEWGITHIIRAGENTARALFAKIATFI